MEPLTLKEWVGWHESDDPKKAAQDRLKYLMERSEPAREAVLLLASLQEMAFFNAVEKEMRGLVNTKKTYLTALEEAHTQYLNLLERKDDGRSE